MSSNILNLASVVLWRCTFVAAVVAAVVYGLQLRVMRRTLTQTSIPALIQYLESPTARDARRVVNRELRTKPYASWDEDDRAAAQEVCSSFDVAGTLARLGKVDSDFILAHWGGSARRAAYICREFIDELQSKEGEWYFAGLLWLSGEAAS